MLLQAISLHRSQDGPASSLDATFDLISSANGGTAVIDESERLTPQQFEMFRHILDQGCPLTIVLVGLDLDTISDRGGFA